MQRSNSWYIWKTLQGYLPGGLNGYNMRTPPLKSASQSRSFIKTLSKRRLDEYLASVEIVRVFGIVNDWQLAEQELINFVNGVFKQVLKNGNSSVQKKQLIIPTS